MGGDAAGMECAAGICGKTGDQTASRFFKNA